MRGELPRAAVFPLAAVVWSLGLFGLLRTSWVEGRFVLPLTRLQEQAAEYYAGRPSAPMAVTADCSGTDVLALCLAAILACPVSWRARVTAATGGIALIMALNTIRIATLGRAASSPALFQTLHLQVWPVILVLATAAYVFVWMKGALRTSATTAPSDTEQSALSLLMRRFAPRAVVLLIAFALCGPLIERSQALIEAGAWAVWGGAFLLNSVGVAAAASGNVLTTNRGSFMVTPECLATALIPLYVAAIFTFRLDWPRRALALVVAPPLFAALAIVRLLLLALPPVLAASPLFLVHGFHQFVLAIVAVVLLALWREPVTPERWARGAGRACSALGAATLFAIVGGSAITIGVFGLAGELAPHRLMDLAPPGDVQGAFAVLPAFQAAFLLALGLAASISGRLLLKAFAALMTSQVLFLAILGQASQRTGLIPHPLLVRAWAVGIPLALILMMLRDRQRSPAAALGLALDRAG